MPVVYANAAEVPIRRSRTQNSSRRATALLGQWLETVGENGDWREVRTRGSGNSVKQGWVHKDEIIDRQALKVFFVDVGQGDGAVIEAPQGRRILIDGGPNRLLYDWIVRRSEPIFAEQDAGGQPRNVHFDAMVVSHPDDDHFTGFSALLRDNRFSVGTIFHNGIIRYNEDLVTVASPIGTLVDRQIDNKPRQVLTETYSSLDEAEALINGGLLKTRFRQFWEAALDARDDNRLNAAQRLTYRDGVLPGYGGDPAQELRVEVLGPVTTSPNGAIEYVGFASPEHPNSGTSVSHTINGHSIVLKLRYGQHSFLFGGDLNIPAQRHLIAHYGNANPFAADVAKACHHGSSDFHVRFLERVNPQVNVFSSGEERLHDHPMPDAMGAAARHARGTIPLLFSTELARAEFSSRTHYGRINARSNGTLLVMAQYKERQGTDPWHTFSVPYQGKFS